MTALARGAVLGQMCAAGIRLVLWLLYLFFFEACLWLHGYPIILSLC